jgi:DNA-binding PadR family transcriptional regulator
MRIMKQTEGVPRGLLRFIVLKFLAERSMSGVEIVEKIAQETKGKWKPSPGSIYPLLSGLQQRGFTVESSKNESGMKQYTLTEEGRKSYREQVKLGQEFMEKMRCLVPIFIEGFQTEIDDKNLFAIKESAKSFLQTFLELDTIKHKLTKENIFEIVKILDRSNCDLLEIIQKIDGKNNR